MSNQVDVAKRVDMFVKTMKDNGINANLDTMIFDPKEGISRYVIELDNLSDENTNKLNKILEMAQFTPKGTKKMPSGTDANVYERREGSDICELLIVRDKNNQRKANIIINVKNT